MKGLFVARAVWCFVGIPMLMTGCSRSLMSPPPEMIILVDKGSLGKYFFSDLKRGVLSSEENLAFEYIKVAHKIQPKTEEEKREFTNVMDAAMHSNYGLIRINAIWCSDKCDSRIVGLLQREARQDKDFRIRLTAVIYMVKFNPEITYRCLVELFNESRCFEEQEIILAQASDEDAMAGDKEHHLFRDFLMMVIISKDTSERLRETAITEIQRLKDLDENTRAKLKPWLNAGTERTGTEGPANGK